MTEAEFKKIEECNAVSDLLPLEFRNGTRIDEIGTTCGNCEKEIPSGTIRGSITKLNEHCISFHGHGICYGCKTVTLIDVRFADDGSFLCKINDSWKRRMITRNNLGLITILWHHFKSFKNRLRG